MNFCTKCGAQLPDGYSFCPNCGSAVYLQNSESAQQPVKSPSTLTAVAKAFMIVGTVFMGLYIIPLAWCLPMTIHYFKAVKNNQPVSTGFKVCALLFVNTIAGILMLCDKEY